MKKKEIKRLDTEWLNKVRERDGYICQICKKKGNQAHHIMPKMFKETRYELDNGITLCCSCHIFNKYSAHKNSVWFYHWLKKNRPEQLLKAELYLGEK